MLIHGVISPPEATSYDKLKSFSGYSFCTFKGDDSVAKK